MSLRNEALILCVLFSLFAACGDDTSEATGTTGNIDGADTTDVLDAGGTDTAGTDDSTDGNDATDSEDTSDASTSDDAAESTDDTSDSTDQSDGTDAEDATESSDGATATESSDSTDTSDGVDNADGETSSSDVTDAADTTDGVDAVDDTASSLPNAELFVKIVGTPLQATGATHIAVPGGVTPITGIAFGEPDSITWTHAGGDTGEASLQDAFWQTGAIALNTGVNEITVTATKGDETRTDTVYITYNPSFLFDRDPTISPDQLWQNESTNMIVTVPITIYKTFSSNSVKLYQSDAEGGLVGNSLGTLVDNGNLSQCDEIDQDGVFSACIKNYSCTGPDVYFVVSADIETETGNYTAYSAPIRVECGQRVTVASCTASQGILTNARTEYDAAATSSTPEQARDATISWLVNQAGVSAAGPAAGDGYGVWVEFVDGYLGAINLAPAGMRGGPAAIGAAQQISQLASTQLFNTQVIDSKKALVLAPYNQEFATAGGDEAQDLGTSLTDSGCPTFAVEGPLGNASATLEKFRNQYLYGVVIATTHGDALFGDLPADAKAKYDWDHQGNQEIMWSGEPVNCSALSTNSPSCSGPGSCPAGQECVITSGTGTNLSGQCVDRTQMDLRKGRVIITDENWAMAPTFISRHAKLRFPNSLVYTGACRSLYNGSLGAEYIASGAKAFAGFGDYVYNEYAYTAGLAFGQAMVSESKLTGAAFFSAPNEDPNAQGGQFRLFGATNLDIMDANIINESFETGDLTGWDRDGDGRVISKLGISIPVHGKFMSVISTGLGFTVQTGEIYQDFCIPGDKTQMTFYWKFFSEEFKEWCGSSFQDTLQATVANNVGQITLVNTKVDDLCHYEDGTCDSCPDPGIGNCQCGSQYVGLIASDVSFDQGGVYNVQWQKSETDVTALAGGGPVQLKFFATDQGDSIYDTVILIDAITIK